jgi:hypothetical protein
MIRCIKFRPCQKNTLLGFADLELTRVGLVMPASSNDANPSARRTVRSRASWPASAPDRSKTESWKTNCRPSLPSNGLCITAPRRKTTIHGIEIVAAPAPWKAIVTFTGLDEVRKYLSECVLSGARRMAACT